MFPMFPMTHYRQSNYSIASNNIYYWYYITVRTAFVLFVYLMRITGLWHPYKKPVSNIEVYENKIIPLFLKFADYQTEQEHRERNQNVESLFYKRKELTEMMKTENDIEKRWKKRILMEYTPRDNIIMFYDAYKGGFSYYCDHTVVPIRILNAMAMKYVMRYYCLDFFVDEVALQGNNSPLISLLNEEDKEENEKIKKIFSNLSKNTNIETNKLPFLKSKHNKPSIMPRGDWNDMEGNPPPPKEKRMNKFIYLGKFNNFSILQKKTKMHIPALNAVMGGNEYNFENINYDEYKKRAKK